MGMASANRVALGENSRVTINTIIFRVREGEVAEDPEKLDATDNGSGGYREQSRGPFGLTVTLDALWRAADNRMSLPPNLYAGEEFIFSEGLLIWPDFKNQPLFRYTLPIFFVAECRIRIVGIGNQNYSMIINNQGPYTRPIS